MSPELAAVNDDRHVSRLKSVGVTMPLGSMTLGALWKLGGNLVARREALGSDYPHEQHPYPQLVHDIGVVSEEMARR